MTGGTSSTTGTGRPSRPHARVPVPTRATGQALCPGCATQSPHSCILTRAAPEGQRSRCCCGCVPYVEALRGLKPRGRRTACERSQVKATLELGQKRKQLQGRGATAEGGGGGGLDCGHGGRNGGAGSGSWQQRKWWPQRRLVCRWMVLLSEVGRAGQQVFGGLFPGDAPAQVSEGSWVQGADSNGHIC